MSNNTFWNTAARYCAELAPVMGPLLQAASELATAIDKASITPATLSDARHLPASPEND